MSFRFGHMNVLFVFESSNKLKTQLIPNVNDTNVSLVHLKSSEPALTDLYDLGVFLLQSFHHRALLPRTPGAAHTHNYTVAHRVDCHAASVILRVNRIIEIEIKRKSHFDFHECSDTF